MPTNSPSTPDDTPTNFAKFLEQTKGLEDVGQDHQKSLKATYVIWAHSRFSVLHDPMTSKPVSASNPKLLEEAAKAFEGEIITAQAARDKLLKGHRN
jgi:hypothetical protein